MDHLPRMSLYRNRFSVQKTAQIVRSNLCGFALFPAVSFRFLRFRAAPASAGSSLFARL